MANFDNGVSSYIKGRCTVEVNFPVDSRGKALVCCNQCTYYGRSSKTCELNKQVVNYPDNKIGYACPLEFKED